MDISNLKIARIRHFYDFESINVVNHKQEITFYYDGETTDKLHYFAPDLKEYLNVFDYNGETLQFHGELTEYFDIEYLKSEPNESYYKNEDNKQFSDDNAGFQILIDFPKERLLLKSEFRTIILTDKIDYPITSPGLPISIDVPFDEASHTYLYINKLPQYTAKIDKIFYSRKDINAESNRPNFFELEKSEEKEYLDHFEATSYYCIWSSVPITDCNIFVVIEYKLKGKDWSWFYSGILFGISALALNLHLMINNLHGSLVQIVSVSTIAITYLVVIKGWVFMKDIDDVVGLIPVDIPFKIRFSYVYLLLILLIFVELIIAIYYGTIN
jgi:hypothetical protein